MSGQSWKEAVEEIAGPEPKAAVYKFNSNSSDSSRRKLPPGWFEENKAHGAYDGEVME